MQRKKDYLQPRTEVVVLDLECPFLATSGGEGQGSGPAGGDEPEEARSFQYDDWDDEY